MASQTHLPTVLRNLSIPVIASPMFTVSYPELVVAQCKAGIVGSFPALNARPAELLDDWLAQMTEELTAYADAHPEAIVGPIAVNQIVHTSNVRLEQDVKTCVKHRIPIFISSLHAPVKEILDEVHSYGGIVLHDVINLRHAEKALEAGVDGLILVAAGAGGHAGRMSPFALVGEVRKRFNGPIVLSGSIATGQAILAAQAMGADLAYMGTRFIACPETLVSDRYREMLVRAGAEDVTATAAVTGVACSWLNESLGDAGLSGTQLSAAGQIDFSDVHGDHKPWKDIFGAGQGVGKIDQIEMVGEVADKIVAEYRSAATTFAATAI